MSFSEADVPSQEGKVVIVTGGNAGIGRQTCRIMLEKGARVYMLARNQEKAEKTIAELKTETGKEDIHFIHLDLADLETVPLAAEEFKRRERELHILYLNAGALAPSLSFTKQGIENTFGCNALGHFLLTQLLVPVLESTAASLPRGTVRMVWTASEMWKRGPKEMINFEDLTLPGQWFGNSKRYGQSKLAIIILSNEYARRLNEKGIFSISLHPGVAASDGIQNQIPYPFFALAKLVLYTPSQGAYTQLFAGTSPKVIERDLNGKYLVPFDKISPVKCGDQAFAEKVWNFCLEKIEPFFVPPPAAASSSSTL